MKIYSKSKSFLIGFLTFIFSIFLSVSAKSDKIVANSDPCNTKKFAVASSCRNFKLPITVGLTSAFATTWDDDWGIMSHEKFSIEKLKIMQAEIRKNLDEQPNNVELLNRLVSVNEAIIKKLEIKILSE